MERVWILSEELYAKRDSMPTNRHAEIVFVKDLAEFRTSLSEGERAVLTLKGRLLADLVTRTLLGW